MITTKANPQIIDVLKTVTDPEVPVLTVIDLGVVREVLELEDGTVEVIITPTYSGCPAMNTIEINIKAALQEAGYQKIKVTTILSPAWTTAWLSEEGKKKLKAYGIAPPVEGSMDKNALFQEDKKVECPQCNSMNTKMVSQFGSTACKSLYKCNDCLEPFDYFKCH
ncbi:MAG: phenylacetate-CoA oxygenase subunit PaaJ [Bacteroidetes bacterium]|jgi:ring-1,2-phenylacetyl-CoA epoxidase subunit PaaD|nr:phenylacetate-CoA oxygenase subunit PaaJ [Bacteroidota bacterium]